MAPLWSVKKEVFKGNPGISSIMDKRLPKTARKCFLHSMYDILFKIVSITDWDWKWILQAICSFYIERFLKNHVIPWFINIMYFPFRKTTLQFVSGCYTFIRWLELRLFTFGSFWKLEGKFEFKNWNQF